MNEKLFKVLKFSSLLFYVASAVYINIVGANILPWMPDVLLMSLVALAFVFSFSEIFIISLLAGLLMDWAPGLNIEFVLVVFLPIIAHVIGKYFQHMETLAIPATLLGSIVVFYAFTNFKEIISDPLLFLYLMFADFVIGMVVFIFFRKIYPPKSSF